MEKAFHALSEQARPGWSLTRSYGLKPDLLAVTQAWEVVGQGGYFVATKGAPEAIASLCHLAKDEFAALQAEVEQMAGSGLRVLGIAAAHHDGGTWPASPHDFDFHLVGLVGLSDPLRRSVPDAVALCRSAGVRVVMITGDHPKTAQAIAQAAGLSGDAVLTGTDVAGMDDAQLSEAVRSAAVFARILPEQKLRIVEALKRNGDVVAMTGDGVNDAPSLKAADIGIAMGGRGTDVAREAASLVLLDDDFGSIVTAIRLGRRIYDNLRKAMSFIVAVHVPVAGLAVIPLLTGLPILLWPVHIAFLEMIIDPVCSLAFEAEVEEADIMARPPRSPQSTLLSGPMMVWSAAQGVTVLALAFGLYLAGHALGMPDDELRALVYFALVAGIMALIVVNRSTSASLLEAVRRPNRTLVVIFAAILAVLGASLAWPFAVHLFGFGPLHLPDLAIVAAVGIVTLGLLEGVKLVWRERVRP
jgi:P-type Ca2+ transporter type 2C